MREIYRILDANFNRAREALRVAEDCGRFALNDPAITAMAKNLRSDLKEILQELPAREMITSRNTSGDIGTEITSPSEPKRTGLEDVALAACKRLGESLRTIEEYLKFVSPEHVLKIERMRYNGYTLEQRLVSRLMVPAQFRDVRLYVLVTSSMCPGCVRDRVRSALAGGADAIQLREKDVSDATFLAMAAELRELTDEMGKLFIVNDRPDIAAIVGADGVHVGQGDISVPEIRRLLRPGAIIGKSTHSVAQAKAAVNEGADYIGIGPVYSSTTKKDLPDVVGPEMVSKVCQAVELPVVPIGGIAAANVKEVVAAGAKRIAVASGVMAVDDPKQAAVELLTMMEDAAKED
ncbi:MAG: thiamine phosphate synthase [Phycisphaerae bacterium]